MTVERSADWRTCRRILGAVSCPVALVTDFIAAERRYREWAFQIGIRAYLRKPCTRGGLREMIERIAAGENEVEIVDGRARPRVRE